MIGMLLITHTNIGTEMIEAARGTFGKLPIDVDCLSVQRDDDTNHVLEEASKRVKALDQGNGILVLTDVFGSTPSNIAHALTQKHHVRVITGVNLPMLFRIFNYAHLDLEQIISKAVSGGKEGIVAREVSIGEAI